MTRHYISLVAACVLFVSIIVSVIGSESKILLDKPPKMNKTLQGKPESTWMVARSIEVPGKPYEVYRCNVDIKLQTKTGKVAVTVRQISKSGKSICYTPVASLDPGLLEFDRYSTVFLASKNTARLQVYYRLNLVSGSASFKNLVLEKLSKEEGEKAMEAMKVPPAYFSLPVYCYSDGKKLSWGYRVNDKLSPQGKNVSKIIFECPQKKLKTEIVPIKGKQTVNVVNWQFKEGDHHLTATALDASGKVLTHETVSLKSIKRPVLKNYLPLKKVGVDKNGALMVNDKTVFFMGVYQNANNLKAFKQIRNQGFNTIRLWSQDLAEFKRILDMSQQTGLMGFCVTKMIEDEKLKILVSSLKDHPANLMWDLVDEPIIKNITSQQVKVKADVIRSVDKNGLIKISFADPTRAGKYEQCLDIASTHRYPVPFGKVTDVSKGMDTLTKSFGGRVPTHFTPQAWMHYNDRKMKEQSVAQTRAMTYLAIIHGAKGLCYYAFFGRSWDVRKYPRLWSTFIGINNEIETLTKIILEGKKIKQISMSPAKIDFAAWEYAGNRYVIAVNTLEKNADGLLSVTDWQKFKLQEMFSDEKAVLCKSKSGFKSKFTPLQTKIFKISKNWR